MTALLLFFCILPILSYVACNKALKFKGFVIPSLSYKLCLYFGIIDFLSKLSFWPLCEDSESYLICCMLVDSVLLGIYLIRIYWCINKKNIRAVKKFPSDENYTLLGMKLATFCIVKLLVESVFFYVSWEWEDPTEILFMVVFFASISLLYIAFVFMELIRLDRIKFPSMRSLTALQSNKSPLVLLRSFQLDKNPYWNNKTFDESLCESIDTNDCPIISLSDPDQFLPSGGSLKIQSKDDCWKQVVVELFHKCRAVVLVEGNSDGLGWEIDTIRKTFDKTPEKVFIIVPANKYRLLAWLIDDTNGGMGMTRNLSALMLRIVSPIKMRKELKLVWTNFVDYMHEHNYDIPKSFPGDNVFIFFDKQWRARISDRFSSGKDMFDAILRKSPAECNDYDYSHLATTISTFEVNGFLDRNSVDECKRKVSQLIKLSRILVVFFFLFTFISWFLV